MLNYKSSLLKFPKVLKHAQRIDELTKNYRIHEIGALVQTYR